MGIDTQHEMMQDAFLESKDIINQIFRVMKAPETWQIKHMTFTELVGALYKIQSLCDMSYHDDDPHIEYIIDTFDGDITSDDILSGKIAYSKGEKIIGTMPEYNIGDIILDEEWEEQELNQGYYKVSRIRIQLQEKYAHPSVNEQIIEPDDDHVLSRVFVDGDEDLIPQNIKKDTIIFGVTGTLEEIKNYNIIYVVNVPKQITYKQQVEYDKPFFIIDTQPALDNYEFKGWSSTPYAEIATYQPNQEITTNLANKGDSYILYAVFEATILTDITLDISYQNNGKLVNNQEIATITIHGGNLSSGYGNIQREVQCNDNIISEFTDQTLNEYSCQVEFNEVGIYPVIVIHKYNNKQVQATGIIKVAGENGKMNGEGTMTFETNPTVSYFDSGWVSNNIIKGCWIKDFNYHYQSDRGHSSELDELAVFGKTTSGKVILLYDFGNNTNIGKEITLSNNITGADIYNNGLYRLSVGSCTLTNGNLRDDPWNITDTFTKNDDIRQIRFFASSNHGYSCFQNADIDYDIQYEFDMDLWESDNES